MYMHITKGLDYFIPKFGMFDGTLLRGSLGKRSVIRYLGNTRAKHIRKVVTTVLIQC